MKTIAINAENVQIIQYITSQQKSVIVKKDLLVMEILVEIVMLLKHGIQIPKLANVHLMLF
jgi:hypothetical protein